MDSLTRPSTDYARHKALLSRLLRDGERKEPQQTVIMRHVKLYAIVACLFGTARRLGEHLDQRGQLAIRQLAAHLLRGL